LGDGRLNGTEESAQIDVAEGKLIMVTNLEENPTGRGGKRGGHKMSQIAEVLDREPLRKSALGWLESLAKGRLELEGTGKTQITLNCGHRVSIIAKGRRVPVDRCRLDSTGKRESPRTRR